MDKTKATMTVVCDAGPIIHLDELGCLHLLSDFQEIFLPDTVWACSGTPMIYGKKLL